MTIKEGQPAPDFTAPATSDPRCRYTAPQMMPTAAVMRTMNDMAR